MMCYVVILLKMSTGDASQVIHQYHVWFQVRLRTLER